MSDEQATPHEMPKAEVREEHRWLQKLVGEWEYEHSYTDGEGNTHTARGRETVRALGDLWVLLEGSGDMPGGGTAQMLMTLGFDPGRERFVGTWVGSMMTHLWLYEGRLEGDRLVLESEGPDMTGAGGTARYRDVVALEGSGERTLTGNVQGPDGGWTEMMTARYRRR
jgi:hypothetical protein